MMNINAQDTLTLSQCREMALENNKQIVIAEYKKMQSQHTIKAYRGNFFPEFSIGGGYFYSTNSLEKMVGLHDFLPSQLGGLIGELPDAPIELQLSHTWTAGISARQPVYMGGKIRHAYKMSKIGSELAELNKSLTETEVLAQTDEAFWAYVKTTELLKSAQKFKEVVAELFRVVQNAQGSGVKSKNDVLKVQVKLNEAELQLRQAENGVRLSRMNLCHVIGLPFESEIIPPGAFEDSSIEVNYATDVTQRLEYSLLNKQVELKDRQIKLVRSDFLPNVGVMANYGYTQGLKLNDDLLLDNAGFSALVSVNIPLFHWGEGRSKIRVAQNERDIAQLQFEDMNEKMMLELMQALHAYDESILEATLTERSFEQAEENLRVSRNQYEAGMETLADYLEAQTVWQKASSDMINAKAAMKCAETYYLKAAGELR
jgi:outer membrane protein TolC